MLGLLPTSSSCEVVWGAGESDLDQAGPVQAKARCSSSSGEVPRYLSACVSTWASAWEPACSTPPELSSQAGQPGPDKERRGGGGGDGCVTRPYFVEMPGLHRDPRPFPSVASPHPRTHAPTTGAAPSDPRTAAVESSSSALPVPAAITSWLFDSTMRARHF